MTQLRRAVYAALTLTCLSAASLLMPPAASAVGHGQAAAIPRGALFGVAAVSARDVWAVGSFGETTNKTLIMHWNGRALEPGRQPEPGRSASTPISCSASRR